jgi:hypothetical protein
VKISHRSCAQASLARSWQRNRIQLDERQRETEPIHESLPHPDVEEVPQACLGHAGSLHRRAAHQWKVMSVLYGVATMPAFEVAKYVTLDKAAISRAVRQLLELGFAERALRQSDARRIDVSLTRKGRACYARMAAQIARLQETCSRLSAKSTSAPCSARSMRSRRN